MSGRKSDASTKYAPIIALEFRVIGRKRYLDKESNPVVFVVRCIRFGG
jgi:hypothetical protein